MTTLMDQYHAGTSARARAVFDVLKTQPGWSGIETRGPVVLFPSRIGDAGARYHVAEIAGQFDTHGEMFTIAMRTATPRRVPCVLDDHVCDGFDEEVKTWRVTR